MGRPPKGGTAPVDMQGYLPLPEDEPVVLDTVPVPLDPLDMSWSWAQAETKATEAKSAKIFSRIIHPFNKLS